MKKALRSKTDNDFFGHPSRLPYNKLPLEREVYNFFRQESNRIRQCGGRNTSQRRIAIGVAKQVRSLWESKANLPVKSVQSVVRYVPAVVRKAQTLTKDGANSKQRSATKQNLPLQALFDICACQCKTKHVCKCPKENKVAELEWDFLRDQRGERSRIIVGVDRKTSKAWARRRKADERLRSAGQPAQEHAESGDPDGPSVMDESPGPFGAEPSGQPDAGLSPQPDSDGEPEPWCPDKGWNEEEEVATEVSNGTSPGTVNVRIQENVIPIDNFARECDRYGISDRAAAALGTALLVDLGIVTDSDKTNVITRDKVRRARGKTREETKEKLQKETKGRVQCIGFDGRQDVTNILEENEQGDKVRSVGREKHLVCVAEPGGRYIAHRTLTSENSQSVA